MGLQNDLLSDTLQIYNPINDDNISNMVTSYLRMIC